MSLPAFFFDRVTAEIRQQMAGIAALTDQLARQRLTPDAQACVSGVSEAADTVLRVLTAALDLRQVAAEGVRLERGPVRLRELMDQVQDQWRAAAAMAGVTLLVSYDGDPDACVVTDRTRLLQVFDGFIGEAVGGARRGAVEASLRAVPAGEGLRIEGRVRGARDPSWDSRELELRVRDVAGQFGLEVALGVLLARSLVEELGGRLTDEVNAGAGHTLVFELELPKAVAESQPEPPATSRPAHVLVVDDNATNRMVAQALCEMFDCSCEAAEDGAAAVEIARTGRFDLILMDIKMPGMDGITAARAIRALPGPAGQAPIVALTANADPDDAAAYLSAGMDGVIEKPMKPEHLLAVLQQAVAGVDAAAAAAA